MAGNALLEMLSKKMGYLTQRQAVIADNIANANTPGFMPKDLVSFDKVLEQTSGGSGGTGGLQMVATNAMHLSGAGGGSGGYKSETQKDIYEIKPGGNGVVLEQQMTQLSQNYSDYSMVTGLYHQVMNLIKTAASHSGS